MTLPESSEPSQQEILSSSRGGAEPSAREVPDVSIQQSFHQIQLLFPSLTDAVERLADKHPDLAHKIVDDIIQRTPDRPGPVRVSDKSYRRQAANGATSQATRHRFQPKHDRSGRWLIIKDVTVKDRTAGEVSRVNFVSVECGWPLNPAGMRFAVGGDRFGDREAGSDA